MLKLPEHLRSASLKLLCFFNILVDQEAQSWAAILDAPPQQCHVPGDKRVPSFVGHTLPDGVQTVVCLICNENTLLAHVQLGVHCWSYPFQQGGYSASWFPAFSVHSIMQAATLVIIIIILKKGNLLNC